MCTNCFVIGKKSIRKERKEHNFQTDENIALLYLKRKKKTNFSELTQVFCGYCLYCLITSKRKQMHQCHTYCCFLSRHTTQCIPRPVGERVRSVMRPNNGCERVVCEM